MEGTACCYGGATVVNGIVRGQGASFSIGLKTTAKVTLTNEPGRFDVRILSDMTEDDMLAKICVVDVLKNFGLEREYGGKVITRSDIPISRGLKSSSASANAIILATLKALGEQLDDMEIINLGVNASIKANVTITGAFDDACATYFGCLVMADNQRRSIIKQYDIEEDLAVLIHIPDQKIRKTEVDVSRTAIISDTIDHALELTRNGRYKEALVLNGLSYGQAMGLDTGIAGMAMGSGALAAGISGTGPATVILCEPFNVDPIIQRIGYEGTLETRINHTKATVL